MALAGKLVSEVKINVAAEKYYKIWKDEVSRVPKICPKYIQKVEVHEGDWDCHGHGSVKIWHYSIDGKAGFFKERVEFDDKNMAMLLIGLDGDMFEHYKSFKATYKVVPKGPNHCLAVMILKYEKLRADCPSPYKYIDLMNGLTKSIESYLQ
ncbi:MLP-like protein 328 [Cucurbita maxima]|uniref:MLP-like protein 328 n=1 Tax=Cucurbita maxima TaxID=3661 RepID=A0A6J1KBN7_CUCMA|nr:MLP-like protein 328 [Cucurbita maxima]